MKPSRLTWIDHARGIAIILVLYRHVFEGIKNSGMSISNYLSIEYANIMFFSFRMPLFFIVSGVFIAGSLQKRGLLQFIDTKARTILYPYFLWAFLQITLQIIFSKYTNSQRAPFDYLYIFYLPRKLEQFWYLYTLFAVTILYVIAKVKLGIKPVPNILIGLVLFYVSAWLHQQDINSWFMGDLLHYYVFIGIGDAISDFIRNRNNFRIMESWKLLLLLLLPFLATQYYYLRENLNHLKPGAAHNDYDFVEYFQPFLFILIALLGCMFVINLCFVLQKHKVMNWLHTLGRHSLYIYVAHVLVLSSTRVFMTRILNIHHVPTLLVTGIVLGLVIPVILYQLAVKMNMRWLFSLEKTNGKNIAE